MASDGIYTAAGTGMVYVLICPVTCRGTTNGGVLIDEIGERGLRYETSAATFWLRRMFFVGYLCSPSRRIVPFHQRGYHFLRFIRQLPMQWWTA